MKYLVIMFPYIVRQQEIKPEYIDPETQKITPAVYIDVNKTYEDTEAILDKWSFTGKYTFVRSAKDPIYEKLGVKYQVFCIPADRVEAKLKTELVKIVTDIAIVDFLVKEEVKLIEKEVALTYTITEDIAGWCSKNGFVKKEQDDLEI